MNGYVYSPIVDGHRRQYVSFFVDITGLAPLIAPLNFRTFIQLLRAKALCLVTYDDKVFLYSILVFLRSLSGKKTSGLVLRPQSCFEGNKVKALVKRVLFSSLKCLPGLSLLAALPFSWRPQYEKICTNWIYDPQFWDLYYERGADLEMPPATAFSSEILQFSNGRKIVMFIGRMSMDKGFDFFQKLATETLSRCDDFVFVAAGKISPEIQAHGELFTQSGGLLVDRFISDEELESLYGISELVWACYAPSYDQTSGVFGRSVQLSVPICVREASLISEITDQISVPHLKLPYNSPKEASEKLSNYVKTLHPSKAKTGRRSNIELLDSWAHHSKAVILRSILGSAGAPNMSTDIDSGI